MYARQLDMEERYNKHQQFPLLMKIFEEGDIVSGEGTEYVLTLLVHMAIQKRMPITAALGILGKKLPLTDAALVVEFCVQNNLVGHKNDELIVYIEPSEEIQEQLKLYMFPPPMLVEPDKITHNRQSGYLSINHSVMTKKSHTEEDVCLDVLNILNSFKFTLNLDVLNTSSLFKSLKNYKEGESHEDYRKRVRQWKRFDTTTRSLITQHYLDVDTIWFTHRYDKRGRIYCQGYNISYQGTEWNKALVQMQPETLND